MKTRYTILVFALMILAGLCFTTCNNPIMEKWWENGSGGGGGSRSTYNWGKYIVQFDMVGGTYVDELSDRTAPDTQIIDAGKTVMHPGLAKKAGQAFGGWYTAPSGGQRWHFGSGGDPVNSNMTLYVHWGDEATGHHVYFREKDGTIIDTDRAVYRPLDEVIVHGELATEPLQFGAKESYSLATSFEYWYTEPTENPWDFQNDPVTEDVTLYAKWNTNSSITNYTIEWDLGISTSINTVPAPIVLAEGSKIPQPLAIIDPPGYAFSGWYTTDDFVREWNFAEDTVSDDHVTKPNKTIVLYAKWSTPGMSGTGNGPGKTFTLGGTSTEYPNTSGGVLVTIQRNFYIDQYEVTNERYLAVMGNVPSRGQGSNMPLNRITWYDALVYCNKLSDLEGLPRVYTLSSIVTGKDGAIEFIKSATVHMDIDSNGYRLPTEAEWEYAARGGEDVVDTPNDFKYAGSDNPDEVAWYDGNSGFVPHPVGQKKPNAIGLYDMSGNLSEWCWDMYSSTIYASYDGQPNPRNDDDPSSKNPTERVRRGGNFNMINVKVRARDNNNKNPTFSWPPAPTDDSLQRYMTIGFRVVRTIP